MKHAIGLIAVLVLAILAVPVLAEIENKTATTLSWREANRIAVARYQEAVQKYQNAVDRYQIARQQFIAMRERVGSFRQANETPELINKTKVFLSNAVNKGINNLELVKKWIDKINISEEKKEELISTIDIHISNLEGLMDDIEAIETKEDAIAISKQIRAEWTSARVAVKKAVGLAMVHRTDFVINRLEVLADKLQQRIDSLKAEGKETAQMQDLLDNFNDHLETAKEKYELAKQKFSEISDVGDANKLFAEGRQFLREAHQQLKEAHAKLVEIVKEGRAQNVSVETEISQTAEEVGGEA